MRTLNWRDLAKPELDIMSLVSSAIAEMEIAGRASLPDLRCTDTLFIASDYGGNHKGAGQEIYSFLVIDSESMEVWRHATCTVRARMHDPGRIIAYKRLQDGVVARVVPSLLNAANALNGIVFSIGFDTSIKYITPDAREDRRPDRFSKWSRGAYERMLRVVHTISLLLAGLSREGQNVRWLTDNDQIAADTERSNDLVYALNAVSGMYLPHKLGNLQCSAISGVDEAFLAEDFAAIPDLVAGALCELVTGTPPDERTASTRFVVPLRRKFNAKAKPILDWHMDESQNLKRLFCEIGPTDVPGIHSVYWRQLVKLPRASRSPYVLTV